MTGGEDGISNRSDSFLAFAISEVQRHTDLPMTTIIATPSAMFADSLCTNDCGANFLTVKIERVRAKDQELLIGAAGAAGDMGLLIGLLRMYGLKELWRLHLRKAGLPLACRKFESDVLVINRKGQMFLIDKQFVP